MELVALQLSCLVAFSERILTMLCSKAMHHVACTILVKTFSARTHDVVTAVLLQQTCQQAHQKFQHAYLKGMQEFKS